MVTPLQTAVLLEKTLFSTRLPTFLGLVKRVLFRIPKGHSSRQRRQKYEEPQLPEIGVTAQ